MRHAADRDPAPHPRRRRPRHHRRRPPPSLPDGGSWLALSRGTTDFHPAAVTGPAAAAYDQAIAPLVLCPRAAIEAFFNGFTQEEPGLVQAPLWRPDGKPLSSKDLWKSIYARVATKT